MLENGAKTTELTVDGYTYLELAPLDFAEKLLAHGADINQKNESGISALGNYLSVLEEPEIIRWIDLAKKYRMKITEQEFISWEENPHRQYNALKQLLGLSGDGAPIKYLEYAKAIDDIDYEIKNADVLFYVAAFGDINERVPIGQINTLKNDSGDVLINIASKHGNIKNVRWLYENGANVHIPNNGDRRDAFDQAIENGQLDVVKYFFENGEDIKSLPYREYPTGTANHMIKIARNKDEEMFRFLLLHYPLCYNDADVKFGIIESIKTQDLKMTELFLQNIYDVDAIGEDIIFECCSSGTAELLKLIDKYLKNGHENASNLYYALSFNTSDNATKIILYLLNKNPELIKEQNDALPKAILRGNIEAVKILVDAGVDINGTYYDSGKTAIIIAAEGDDEIFKYLLECGANPMKKDNTGKSAFDYVKNYYDDNKLYLIESIVEVN